MDDKQAILDEMLYRTIAHLRIDYPNYVSDAWLLEKARKYIMSLDLILTAQEGEVCQSCFDPDCKDKECENSMENAIAQRKIGEFRAEKGDSQNYADWEVGDFEDWLDKDGEEV